MAARCIHPLFFFTSSLGVAFKNELVGTLWRVSNLSFGDSHLHRIFSDMNTSWGYFEGSRIEDGTLARLPAFDLKPKRHNAPLPSA